MIRHLDLIATPGPPSYALLDSGCGRKLERFGGVVLDRPEPQALWTRSSSTSAWGKAHAVFSASGEDDEKGRWRLDAAVPENFPIKLDAVTMLGRLSGLWHVGLFPEQLPHWQAMQAFLPQVVGERPRVLNLFAYTGAATLLAAAAGAEVTHVDASKKAVAWARDNQTASQLMQAPIRWIVDDARKFVSREVRRGRTYHVILVDPPKFGRGPDGEVWDLFQHLVPLLQDCTHLVASGSAMLILTSYAVRASALMLERTLSEAMAAQSGEIVCGELALIEAGGEGKRLLPTSMFASWRRSGPTGR